METRAVYGVGQAEIRPECLRALADGWAVPSGAEIRAALKMAGTNGVDFARRIGVDDRTVRRWMLEEKPMPFAAWQVLATRAGLSPEW
ncbi:hypothetical protein SSTU70S_05619 [Stutzerimonas stutzeri]